MDKSLRVAKLSIIDMRKRIILYYIITSIVLMFFVNIGRFGNILLPVIMDVLTFVFLFSCSSNNFKKKFNFAQSNNISRNTFVKGTVISIVPIAGIMAVMDFAVNRAVNVYIKSPTFYDLLFTGFKDLSNLQERLNWIQDGSLGAILGSILFSFMIYCLAYAMGLIPGVFSCRSSDKAQMGFSFVWVASIWIWLSIDDRFAIFDKIKMLIKSGFMVVVLYVVILLGCILGCFKLIKKAQCSK